MVRFLLKKVSKGVERFRKVLIGVKKSFGTVDNGSWSIWVFHGDRGGTPQSVEVSLAINRSLRGTVGVSQGVKLPTNEIRAFSSG